MSIGEEPILHLSKIINSFLVKSHSGAIAIDRACFSFNFG